MNVVLVKIIHYNTIQPFCQSGILQTPDKTWIKAEQEQRLFLKEEIYHMGPATSSNTIEFYSFGPDYLDKVRCSALFLCEALVKRSEACGQ